jgi:uncharacterized membrane protein
MNLVIAIAILGAGLVTGLLFAFSNFVLQSLGDLPDDEGMYAMQRINERIINPLFLLLFLGTPVLCTAIAVSMLYTLGDSGALLKLAGAIFYMAGPFSITVLFNVPLNNRLAAADLSDAGEVWPSYQAQWQRWNHRRTFLGAVAIVLLAAGLGASG